MELEQNFNQPSDIDEKGFSRMTLINENIKAIDILRNDITPNDKVTFSNKMTRQYKVYQNNINQNGILPYNIYLNDSFKLYLANWRSSLASCRMISNRMTSIRLISGRMAFSITTLA
jgi:hypothetical protein